MNESLLRIYTEVDDEPTFTDIRHWLEAHGGRMLLNSLTKTKGEISAAVEVPSGGGADETWPLRRCDRDIALHRLDRFSSVSKFRRRNRAAMRPIDATD